MKQIITNINNQSLSITHGASVIESAKILGLELPRFCYHQNLSVSGNCRMCLVEVEKVDKPMAGCVTQVETGMYTYLDSVFARKARENNYRFILLNHPLDCPICDQAGECDLQDQAKLVGSPLYANFLGRKTTEDKYFGPAIRTVMTRCITCTRCVRFASEIADQEMLGSLGRGEHTEIGQYDDKVFTSNISGNVIDLCPVGALNSSADVFRHRPWELRRENTVDATNSLYASIEVESKEGVIERVLPGREQVEYHGLISDKTRYSFLKTTEKRITIPYQRIPDKKQKTKLMPMSYLSFNETMASYLKKTIINYYDKHKQGSLYIVNDEVDNDSLMMLNHLKNLNPKGFFNAYQTAISIEPNNYYINLQFNILKELQTKENQDNTITRIFFGNSINSVLPSLGGSLKTNRNVRNKTTNFAIGFNELGIDNFGSSMSPLLNIVKLKNKDTTKALINSDRVFVYSEKLLKQWKNFSNLMSHNVRAFFPDIHFILSNKKNIIGLFENNISFFKKRNFLFNTNETAKVYFKLKKTVKLQKLLKFNKFRDYVLAISNNSKLSANAEIIVPVVTSFEAENFYTTLDGQLKKTTIANGNKSQKGLSIFSFFINMSNNSLKFAKIISRLKDVKSFWNNRNDEMEILKDEIISLDKNKLCFLHN